MFQASDLYLTEPEVLAEIDDARKNNKNTMESGTNITYILL